MNDEDVAWAIAALERNLEWQDAEFRRRFQRVEQRRALKAVAVTLLFALAVLLVATGLAAGALPLGFLGLGFLGLSVGVDRCYRWRMRRAR